MCQLLGISSNKKVDINFSLIEFKHRGIINSHGWGFAFIEGENWKIIKRPTSLYGEDIKQEKFKFKSKIIIGHVRLASCGEKVHENTHPFNIGKWIFAHNGTVEVKDFPLFKYKPEGDTDSEYAFCYLLEQIEKTSDDVLHVIEKEADKIRELGRFNFLLTDGEKIYAYGDDNLWYVQRKAPFEFVTLKDEQYEVNLAEIKGHDEKAILIATEPLTRNEKWEKISGLMVFKDGDIFNFEIK